MKFQFQILVKQENVKWNLIIVRGLHPIQVKIEEDKVLNILNKYKRATYGFVLIRLLFTSGIKNVTG